MVKRKKEEPFTEKPLKFQRLGKPGTIKQDGAGSDDQTFGIKFKIKKSSGG
ncbi:hypothetical protein LCGC14_0721500 [marine sediment metagenome]|uniref:Uncharacterized protein n=1 Tax=marine sediment metagenome TaxID=412755 RepID=A0A0F9QXA2_9ZZZZ